MQRYINAVRFENPLYTYQMSCFTNNFMSRVPKPGIHEQIARARPASSVGRDSDTDMSVGSFIELDQYIGSSEHESDETN